MASIALPIGSLMDMVCGKETTWVLARTCDEARSVAKHGETFGSKRDAKQALVHAKAQGGRWADLRVFRVVSSVTEEK